MADRPIIFSAPMVSALLGGRKTQTRRKFELPANSGRMKLSATPNIRECKWQRGDRLWVREGGELLHDADDWNGVDRWHVAGWRYADGNLKEFRDFGAPLSEWVGDCSPQKRSPIFMPRWASRLTLLVTDVRVQRLQEISDDDARAEGVLPDGFEGYRGHEGTIGYPTAIWAFRHIWNSINGPDAWDANPWVAAISFTVHRCNIDTMEEGTW